jgi:hypothetical protein
MVVIDLAIISKKLCSLITAYSDHLRTCLMLYPHYVVFMVTHVKQGPLNQILFVGSQERQATNEGQCRTASPMVRMNNK